MEPPSRRISTGLPELGRWSNKSPPGSASSSGIHSRMACHGARWARRNTSSGAGFHVYQPDLPFDLRAESGRMGTRLKGTLIPTRVTPTGSRPAGACVQPRLLNSLPNHRTAPAGMGPAPAAPRGRSRTSSCLVASPSTYGSRRRNRGWVRGPLRVGRRRVFRGRGRRGRHRRSFAGGRRHGSSLRRRAG